MCGKFDTNTNLYTDRLILVAKKLIEFNHCQLHVQKEVEDHGFVLGYGRGGSAARKVLACSAVTYNSVGS